MAQVLALWTQDALARYMQDAAPQIAQKRCFDEKQTGIAFSLQTPTRQHKEGVWRCLEGRDFRRIWDGQHLSQEKQETGNWEQRLLE